MATIRGETNAPALRSGLPFSITCHGSEYNQCAQSSGQQDPLPANIFHCCFLESFFVPLFLASADLLSKVYTKSLAEDFGEKLHPKIEISAHLYNVAEALPAKHFGSYDGFYINPPWGASNDGESVIAFLERGSQATREQSLGIVVIADDPELLWTQEVLRDTQRRALELGYVVSELMPQLHLYHLDDAPDLRSCSCLFRRIEPGCMQVTSEPLEPARLNNFYGKSSPLRFRYVRERPTLNTDRESDQLYILERYEVNNG